MNFFKNKEYYNSIDANLAECMNQTPLIEASQLSTYFGFNKVYLKLEGSLPFSHTFKDRGAITAINYLACNSLNKVAFASCGNMGAAIALVARRKGIKTFAIISDEASLANKTMIHNSNANYVLYKGRFDEIDQIISGFSSKHPDFPCINTNLMPIYAEGLVSLYYELFESLHTKHNEINIVVPTADGTLLTSLYKGYLRMKKEYEDFVVHFILVQPSGCSPLVKAIAEKSTIRYWDESSTEVLSLSVNNPLLNGYNAIKAVNDTKGMAISVKEDYAKKMYNLVGSCEGIIIDDVGSVVIASLNYLKNNSELCGFPTVCLLTSNGLKTMDKQTIDFESHIVNDKDSVIKALFGI